jgi:hypothetical protein
MIKLITMATLLCSGIALDKGRCVKEVVECSTNPWDILKADRDIKKCVIEQIKKEEERNKKGLK